MTKFYQSDGTKLEIVEVVPGLPSEQAFHIEKQSYDATRPFAVVADFRSFNRVFGRYPSEERAKRRLLDLIRKTQFVSYRYGK